MEKNDNEQGGVMKGFRKIANKGYYGQLVFLRRIRNIDMADDGFNTESYVYDKRLSSGFIVEVSEYFEGYYLVKFFTGDREYHWGTDLFEKIEENTLTYLENKLYYISKKEET